MWGAIGSRAGLTGHVVKGVGVDGDDGRDKKLRQRKLIIFYKKVLICFPLLLSEESATGSIWHLAPQPTAEENAHFKRSRLTAYKISSLIIRT